MQKTLKKNRSSTFTRGLVVTNNTNDLRFCFFELDTGYSISDFNRVIEAYRVFSLDLCIHRSGNGLHFLSPTLVPKSTWKEFHLILKDLNPKCPMTTLRIEPNKYPNEKALWLSGYIWHYFNRYRINSLECVNLLSKFWPHEEILEAKCISTQLKFVRYPLPK